MADPLDRVEVPSPEYQAMVETWTLIDDLMGGTRAMKANASKWLPQEDGEKPQPYRNRVSRSVLFNAFRDTVVDLALRPVSKPVVIRGQDKLPEPLADIADSVDDEQRNLTQFVYELLKVGAQRGLVHILVDYPPDTAPTAAVERERGIKPLFVIVDPERLIGWRFEKAPSGEKTLTQIRLRETGYAEDGNFGVTKVERVRVIYPDRWELWELSEKAGSYSIVEEGPYTLGKIGLVTIYFNRGGFMVSAPPLEDLAHLNLAHFQSQSDHRNNLRFARSGVIFAKGLAPDEVEKDIVWGVNHAFKTTSDTADMKFVEHSGAATEAGENELHHLEAQMESMSKRPLIMQRWGNQTAMNNAIEESKGQCELQAWVRAVEAGVEQAYRFGAEWIGAALPEDFGCDVFDDFGLLAGSQSGLDNLFKIWSQGGLSLRTYLELLKARGELPGNFDVDQEIERIGQEGPGLGMMGREGPGAGGGAPQPGGREPLSPEAMAALMAEAGVVTPGQVEKMTQWMKQTKGRLPRGRAAAAAQREED